MTRAVAAFDLDGDFDTDLGDLVARLTADLVDYQDEKYDAVSSSRCRRWQRLATSTSPQRSLGTCTS